ncbi:unnamed protein product [Citrullus colocynthis]|uniref:Peptidase metallopeptidase domain-containing protein n=1 Tax=Citrullus colocynthis TaxID=252529 RepID=A0ABP0XQE1_9ROSI
MFSVSLKPQTPKGSTNEATRNNSLGGRLGSVDELLNNIGEGYKRGSRKGHNIEGIHSVKTYLQRYGYLSKKYNTIDPNGANNNAFDDHLESSVKKYQKFFKLNESGILDVETLRQMSQPRCSVPDIFENDDNETSVRTSDLHLRSKYTFFPGKPKWPSSTKYSLKYSFIKNFPEEFKVGVNEAFLAWYEQSRFRFSEVDKNVKADIKVSFEVGDHGDGYPFRKGSGVLAHAFGPGDGRFHFNADQSFSVQVRYDKYHVRTVALHELGHCLGLGHSNSEDAIMFPSIPPNFSKGLDMDDVNGLWELYNGFHDV